MEGRKRLKDRPAAAAAVGAAAVVLAVSSPAAAVGLGGPLVQGQLQPGAVEAVSRRWSRCCSRPDPAKRQGQQQS